MLSSENPTANSPAPGGQTARCSSALPQFLKDRLIQWAEGPWAPNPEDLPTAKPGLDPQRPAFRQERISADTGAIIPTINCSLKFMRLSPWSEIYNYDVPLSNLPVELHDLRIAHLSDIHLLKGNRLALDELTLFAKYMGKERVDLVLLSGDLITKGPADLCEESLGVLSRISKFCPLSYMVLGNHDYHGHSHELISKKVEQAGFKMLTNDHVHIRINGTRLNLYGVDDAIFGEPKVPETVEINEFNILLTHNLDAIDRRCSPYLDLMLSGHTHWGEFRFMDGTQLMKFWGYCQDINRHTRGWDRLTERTLSLVHPGLMRYYVPRALCHPPGFVILRLLAQEHDASSTR